MIKINKILFFMFVLGLIFPALADLQKDDFSVKYQEIVTDESQENTISSEVASKIVEQISTKENIPIGRLEVLKIQKAKFELTKKELIEVKAVDIMTGNIYGISSDNKGKEVNKNEVKKQEEAVYRQIYGKATIELKNELSRKNDADKINVGIWLSGGTESEQTIEEESIAKHQVIEAPIIAEIKKKGKIRYASQYAPLIYAELNKKAIREIESIEGVDVVDIEGIAESEINSAIPTIKANLVWPYVKGSGVKVAIVEDDGIAFANPYLMNGIYYKPYDPYIDNTHATMVAGIIASTHGTYKGVAPGVSLLSANTNDQDYSESSLIKASDWALSKGANVLSLSWGIERDGRLHVMDKYYDYITARPPYPIVTKSAGNTGGRITTPGNAWNVITVGAVDDGNTGSWPGDIMAYYSSYIDPISTHSDREKPEVVAVGSRIKSTDVSSPWVPSPEYAGTSFAAPAVAGEAALLMSKNPTLKLWPEAIRAVIFASAVHNIEGSSRLSEKDGMGAVVASEAYNVVAKNQLKYATITPAGSYPIKYTFNTSAGKKVRVVISWNSKSTGPGYGSDTLKVDLDLRVKRLTTGSYAGSSLSHDNNYEIVEFVAPASGIYTAEISKTRWDSGHMSERLGFAYSIT